MSIIAAASARHRPGARPPAFGALAPLEPAGFTRYVEVFGDTLQEPDLGGISHSSHSVALVEAPAGPFTHAVRTHQRGQVEIDGDTGFADRVTPGEWVENIFAGMPVRFERPNHTAATHLVASNTGTRITMADSGLDMSQFRGIEGIPTGNGTMSVHWFPDPEVNLEVLYHCSYFIMRPGDVGEIGYEDNGVGQKQGWIGPLSQGSNEFYYAPRKNNSSVNAPGRRYSEFQMRMFIQTAGLNHGTSPNSPW